MIENTNKGDCLQRDSAEHKGHARVSRSFNLIWKERDSAKPKLLEKKLTPSPVRRVVIPKPDGGIRKLGIPTVIDRIAQQAITQQLTPIYESLFSEGSYEYRPQRSAKDAYGC